MRRLTGWRTGPAILGALAVLVVLCEPAGAQSGGDLDLVDGFEVGIEVSVTLDPTDFDPLTITDTEVSRMRTQLMSDLLVVQMVDQGAARMLAEASSDLRNARDELDQHTEELEALEATLGVAAIEGYIGDSEAEATNIFGLIADSYGIFASETATQLVARRSEALRAVLDATSGLEQAKQRHRIATARKQQAERSIEVHGARRDQFDELVEAHEQAGERADAAAAALSDEVELQSVANAIIVNAEIESEVDRLIADARADGLVIAGGGYRTIAAQVALRLLHCGGSVPLDVEAPTPEAPPDEHAAYAAAVDVHRHRVIYEVPAGACSPPTATPGNSEHQLGLAIDFTDNGTILDRSSDVYVWLVEHGEEYGLINLPSEAWHWSTTGS